MRYRDKSACPADSVRIELDSDKNETVWSVWVPEDPDKPCNVETDWQMWSYGSAPTRSVAVDRLAKELRDLIAGKADPS